MPEMSAATSSRATGSTARPFGVGRGRRILDSGMTTCEVMAWWASALRFEQCLDARFELRQRLRADDLLALDAVAAAPPDHEGRRAAHAGSVLRIRDVGFERLAHALVGNASRQFLLVELHVARELHHRLGVESLDD